MAMVAVTVPRRFAVPGTGEIVGVGFALGLIVTVFGLGRGILRTAGLLQMAVQFVARPE